MVEPPTNKIETVFEEPGSLRKPGFIGRAVRFAFGAWLLWALYTLLRYGWIILVDTTPPSRIEWWLFIILAFWLTPYVVNIGFTRNWWRAPQVVVVAAAALAIVIDLAVYGTWWAPPVGLFALAWLVYFSAHLGLSFVLSALIATPGCEMRAFPHLWTLTTGHSTKEHYCPGALDRIDRWEASCGH
jgi:hypothetical protein